MKAEQLVGKHVIRTAKNKKGDGSWTDGHGTKILHVTDTHIYLASDLPGGKPFALLKAAYDDDNWAEFWQPGPEEHVGPSERARMLLAEVKAHGVVPAVCTHAKPRNYINGKFYCVDCGVEVLS